MIPEPKNYNGTWTLWYKNGRKWREYNFHRMIRYWYADGSKEFELQCYNMKRHGICRYWYRNGQLRYEKNYIHGARVGKQTWYAENGKVIIEGLYQDDKKYNGTFFVPSYGTRIGIEHWKDGKLMQTDWYKDDSIFSTGDTSNPLPVPEEQDSKPAPPQK